MFINVHLLLLLFRYVSVPQPGSAAAVRIFLWFSLGFLIGVIVTQIPIPDSPFSKELEKDSDTLHQFIVNDSKVVVKESRVIAGATASAAHALPGNLTKAQLSARQHSPLL